MTGPLLRLAIAALVIHAALILPGVPQPAAGVLRAVPPELPLLLALLWLGGRIAQVAVTAGLALLVVQKLASLAMYQALGRGFNPVADLMLIDASVRLIAGSFGRPAAVAAVAGAVLALIVIVALIWWAAGCWSRRAGLARAPAAGWLALSVAGVVAAGLATGVWRADSGAYATERIAIARRTLADLAQLRRDAATDPMAGRPDLLRGIDRDVIVVFVESYGRTSFRTPFYADTHLATLGQAQTALRDRGLAMRSGFLIAPTQGGQSWLSHATFANGLWIDDQSRYQAVLASGRQTLFHHARRAGFDTVAVMPAITRPWPESAAMGFDRVLAAGDLGYRGQPFNWVTMPDQFTLTAIERLRAARVGNRRLFLQVALISSHAPWVPVPQMLPWERITDGAGFDAMATAGPTPEEVWRDLDRVRSQYRAAIDYSLRAVTEFAARQGPDGPLLIVLGDHQAAPRIALDEGRDVPIHVIGPPALVARAAAWGLSPGLIPPADAVPLPMDRMRDLILDGFDAVGGRS